MAPDWRRTSPAKIGSLFLAERAGGEKGFELVLDLLGDSCEGLLDQLLAGTALAPPP